MKKLVRIRGVLPTVLRRGVRFEADLLGDGVTSFIAVSDQRLMVRIVFDPASGWITAARTYVPGGLRIRLKVLDATLYGEEADGLLQSASSEQVIDRFAQILVDTRMVRPELDVNKVRRRLKGTVGGAATRSNPSSSRRMNGSTPDLQRVAYTTLQALEGLWARGGDMGYDQGLLVQLDGTVYALKLELWTDACLEDLRRPTPAAAQRRGEALAARWKKENWPATGYITEIAPGIYGCSWAADVANEDELRLAGTDDILQLDEQPFGAPRSNPSASEFQELADQTKVALEHLTVASDKVTGLRVKMQLAVGALERLARSDNGQPLTPEQAKDAGRAIDFLHHIVFINPTASAPHIQAARDVAVDVVDRVGALWRARDYPQSLGRPNPTTAHRVTVDNYEGPVVLDLGPASVRFDNEHGYGAVPNVANIRYMGMVVMMRPSMFLALSQRLEHKRERSLEHLPRMMRTPGWGYPFLDVSLDDGIWTVRGHEGRHRCHVLVEMQCDEEIPVAVFCRGQRARHILARSIDHLREGAVSQDRAFVRGPLFGTAFCDGVEYPPPHAGLYPIG